MACLTSISASRSTSPGGVRSSPNATKVQAPKKSTETTWTVSPSFQWEMFPFITHFNTCWQLCHLSKAALSFLSVCCPAHPFAPPHFAWSTPHLSASSSVPPHAHTPSLSFPSSFFLCRWRWRQQAGDEGRASNGHWRPNWWDPHSALLWLGYDSRPPMHTELAKLCCYLIKLTLHSSSTSNVLLPTKPFYL